ncbi:50S ribosomal protein L10 [Candidatus Sumerlaeota bacterium]|nr:50S ribosomal protein L10 [Candidatus Sumerlaeota bacterium]
MAKLGREARKRRGRAPKIAAVDEVATALQNKSGFVLANNKGLTLAQATSLRKKLREQKVTVKVIKNTLLRKAMEKAGQNHESINHLLNYETVIAIGEDPVTPAKLLIEFAKDNEKLEIKGGLLDGKALDKAQVDALSKLPGREELLARMLGSMMSPIQNTVYALNQTVAKVVYAVDAHRRKLEGAA